VFVDTERRLLLAETQINKIPGLLIGDWDTGRFVRKLDLPYSPVGWRLGPGTGRLTVFYYGGILGVLDFESGEEIVRLKAKEVFIGSGLSLMNFAPDLSKFVAYDNRLTRVFKIFPDHESLVAAARNT
jgi:hypothetical protein